MNIFLELDNLIFISSLPIEDKYSFSQFCRKLDLKSMHILVNLFKEKPEWIAKFYQIVQAKKAVLNKKDKKAWNDIIEKENLDLLEMEIEDI